MVGRALMKVVEGLSSAKEGGDTKERFSPPTQRRENRRRSQRHVVCPSVVATDCRKNEELPKKTICTRARTHTHASYHPPSRSRTRLALPTSAKERESTRTCKHTRAFPRTLLRPALESQHVRLWAPFNEENHYRGIFHSLDS